MKISSLTKWVIVAGLILFCLFLLDSRREMNARNQSLLGQTEVLAAVNDDLRARIAEERREAELTIKQKDGQLQALQSDKIDILAKMAGKDREISKLEDGLVGLTDKDEIIANLKFQIVQRDERHSLAMGAIQKQEEQLRAWEGKFDALLTISEGWKREAASFRDQYLLEKALSDGLRKELGIVKKSNKANLAAEGGVGAYCLIKGDPLPLGVFALLEATKKLTKLL